MEPRTFGDLSPLEVSLPDTFLLGFGEVNACGNACALPSYFCIALQVQI